MGAVIISADKPSFFRVCDYCSADILF